MSTSGSGTRSISGTSRRLKRLGIFPTVESSGNACAYSSLERLQGVFVAACRAEGIDVSVALPREGPWAERYGDLWGVTPSLYDDGTEGIPNAGNFFFRQGYVSPRLGEVWNRDVGREYLDAIVCFPAPAAGRVNAIVHRGLRFFPRGNLARKVVPVVVWPILSYTDDLSLTEDPFVQTLGREAMQACAFHPTVYQSPEAKRIISTGIRKLYAPSVVMNALGNSLESFLGIETDALFPHRGSRGKKIRIIHPEPSRTLKRVSMVLDVCVRVYRLGIPLEIVFTCSEPKNWSEANRPEIKELLNAGVIRFADCTTREKYLKAISGSDVMVFCSKFELYGLAPLEMICGGVVGIFAREPWVQSLYESLDYPFIGQGVQACADILYAVCKDLPAARKRIEGVRKKLLEMHNAVRVNTEKIRWIESLMCRKPVAEFEEGWFDEVAHAGTLEEAEEMAYRRWKNQMARWYVYESWRQMCIDGKGEEA